MIDEFTNDGLCGLCGNYGVIDTRGRMRTPRGIPCGVRAFCICLNGRALKEKGADLERWEAAPSRYYTPSLTLVSDPPEVASPSDDESLTDKIAEVREIRRKGRSLRNLLEVGLCLMAGATAIGVHYAPEVWLSTAVLNVLLAGSFALEHWRLERSLGEVESAAARGVP